jgi:pilus assembly protein CpaF
MFVVSVRERGKEEHRFTFKKPLVVIGRLSSNDIMLPKRNVSKKHSKIEAGPDNRVIVADLGSTNGTYINGKKILEPTPLREGDKIFVGDYIITVDVVDEKAAVDASGVAVPVEKPEGRPAGEERHMQPTASDVEVAMLREEMQRLGLPLEPGADIGGPSTVVIDPSEVPTALPPEPLREPSTLRMSASDPARRAEPVPMDADQMTLRTARPVERAPAAEEILDIPVIEEVAPERAAVQPAGPLPAAAPAPRTITAPEAPASRPTVPTFPRQPLPVAPAAAGPRVLDDVYPEVEAAFLEWSRNAPTEPSRREAVEKVMGLLAAKLGKDVTAIDLDAVAPQVLGELTGLGAVETLLEDPAVGEVFVTPNGRIIAYDWHGRTATSSASLTCPEAVRSLARRVVEVTGHKETHGVVEDHLADATCVKVVLPFPGCGDACVRFVRPFQSEMSLWKLVELGVLSGDAANRLRQAVEAGRSIFVAGRESALNSQLLAALLEAVPAQRKVLVAGDRFNRVPTTARAAFRLRGTDEAELLETALALDAQVLVADQAAGDGAAMLVEVAALAQACMLVSLRTHNASALPSLLGAGSAHPEAELLRLLDLLEPLVVVTGSEKVEGLYLLSAKGSPARLTPFAG